MTESAIEATAPPELQNLPADFWTHAEWVVPVTKQAISLRVDADVLSWFRSQGARYQSRMNAVLRAYMSAHIRKPLPPPKKRRPIG